jgi:hypothetical protein
MYNQKYQTLGAIMAEYLENLLFFNNKDNNNKNEKNSDSKNDNDTLNLLK